MEKTWGNLTFAVLNNAGHFVPMDQPDWSEKMLMRWVDGYGWPHLIPSDPNEGEE